MISSAGYYSFINTSFLGNTAAVEGASRLGGVAEIENCTFIDSVSGENEGPAVSYFRNNTFRCDAGMYRGFVKEVSALL